RRWIPSLEFLTIFIPALLSFLPQHRFYISSVCDCGSGILPCLYTPNDGYYAGHSRYTSFNPNLRSCTQSSVSAWNLYHDSPA
ncbi:hypothetical protein BJ165DRAFT_1511425, partial [Panaeolus papilionaceus]